MLVRVSKITRSELLALYQFFSIIKKRAGRAKGLDVPKAVREATEDYQEEMDIVAMFLDGRTERDDGLSESNTVLYNAYQGWCKQNRQPPFGQKRFTQELQSIGLAQLESRREGRRWKGISIVSAAVARSTDQSPLH